MTIALAAAAATSVQAAPVRVSVLRVGARGLRAVLAAVAVLCLGIHLWLAVELPDARSLVMLGLAAVCAICLLHAKTAPPSTEEWAWMTMAALAMMLLHLGGLGPGGHHPAPAIAAGPLSLAHGLAVGGAAFELLVAMAALAICGVRRRSRR